MRRRRNPRRGFSSRKLWLLVWALVALVQGWDWLREPPRLPPPHPPGQPAPQGGQGPHFQVLPNARLIPDADNDGDSFRVVYEGGEQVLRLYFVDSPETQDYPRVHGRLKDQASYFGGISLRDTLRIGAEARRYTERLLQERTCTVHTRWERVYGSQRVYALVFFEDGEELSEKLVRSGLCRIHTKGTLLPTGQSEHDFEARLRLLESEARAGRRGAWALPKARQVEP